MIETIIRPRVSETDGAGHINNTTLPIWFEAGRDQIFEIFTPDHSFKHWRLVLINSTIDFLQQIYYGKEVQVRTWVKHIGTTSFSLYEELYQEETLCARSTVVYVNFNFDIQSKEKIPDDIREKLHNHILDSFGN